MTAGRYNWYTGDLLTGKIYTRLPLVNDNWTQIVDDASTLQGIVVMSPDVQAMNPWSNAAPCKTWLGVTYVDPSGNETWIDAGPIWTCNYNDDNGQLSIGAAGLWSYWDHRKVMPILADAVSPSMSTVTYSALSLGTIAKRLVQLAQTHTGGNLPLVLPADVVAANDADHTRTYNGYDLTWIGDALTALTGVINGPEIAFVPQYQTDTRFIQWVMRTGLETDPYLHQSGADWIYDASTPKSGVFGTSVVRDGTSMGDEAWVKGNGDNEGTLIGHALGASLTNLGYALFEVDIPNHDSVTTPSTVQSYAEAALLPAKAETLALTLKVHRDASPTVSQVQVGDYVQFSNATNHRYLPPGTTVRSRIVQRQGDSSPLVTLQLAPVPA